MPSLSAESVSIRLLLGGLTALTALSIDICLPALPTIAAALGRDPEGGAVDPDRLSGRIRRRPARGRAAEAIRFGRRPVLLGGLALFTIAALGCGFAGSIEQLTTLRILQGLGGSVGPVLGRTVVRDLFDREDGARVLSYVLMAMTAAPILAPILGVGIFSPSPAGALIFLGLAVYGLLANSHRNVHFLSETNRRPDPTATRPGRMRRQLARLPRQPDGDRERAGHRLHLRRHVRLHLRIPRRCDRRVRPARMGPGGGIRRHLRDACWSAR